MYWWKGCWKGRDDGDEVTPPLAVDPVREDWEESQAKLLLPLLVDIVVVLFFLLMVGKIGAI